MLHYSSGSLFHMQKDKLSSCVNLAFEIIDLGHGGSYWICSLAGKGLLKFLELVFSFPFTSYELN